MKILVLAGGADQIALISELRRRGHTVLLADYLDHPVAAPHAHRHIKVSTLDVEAIEALARDEAVDLVCTACTDQALLTVAQVSERLALPCYISYETARNVTNKTHMKRIMRAHGIPTARYAMVDTPDTDVDADMSYPLVVKPADCNSSKGVRRVDTPAQLHQAIAEALELSRTRRAIVEEYKSGIEVSADFYVDHGVVRYLSATTSNKVRHTDSFTIVQSLYPVLDASGRERVTQIATDIARAFGIDNAPLLVQMIQGPDGYDVVEFSARMGGGSKYHLIHVLSGVDIMAAYVDLILGSKPRVHPEIHQGHVAMNYIYTRPGVFADIRGLDELQHQGVVDRYFLYKAYGSAIHNARTSGDRPAGYLVSAPTAAALHDKQRLVDSSIAVIDPEGRDIMIHNLVP